VGSHLRVWIALTFFVIGMAALVDRLAPSAHVFAYARIWWPLLLVVLGVGGGIRLLATRNVLRGPVVLTATGLVLLLVTRDPLPPAVRPLLWPGLLVLAGTAMLVRLAIAAHAPAPRSALPPRQQYAPRLVCVAESRRLAWPKGTFSLGIVTAVASGCEIDLRRARPLGAEVRLDITAFLSGVDLILPESWRVTYDTRSVGGHCPGPGDNRPGQAGAPQLQVHALVVGAGLEVRYLPDQPPVDGSDGASAGGTA
jgi:hypothetical protein